MRDRGVRGDSQAVSPVIGVVLMVAITVVLAAVLGVMVTGIGDDGPGGPQYTTVSVDSVEKTTGDIHVPTSESGDCEYYHLVIRMTHQQGATLDSSDLEYVIDVSGDDGTTLSGRFNESVARSGVSASAGDEIVIALDSNTSRGAACGGSPSDSKSTVLFDGEPAWHQDEAGQVGELWDIYARILNDPAVTLAEVHVRIVHTPSDTIIVDETYDDIVDVS